MSGFQPFQPSSSSALSIVETAASVYDDLELSGTDRGGGGNGNGNAEDNVNLAKKVLLTLDTASRGDPGNIKKIVGALCDMTDVVVGGTQKVNPVFFAKLALLIAFKRRNHLKSQAEGTGSGEKACFIETILAVLETQGGSGIYDDLIISILPLVSMYGSWKDLSRIALAVTSERFRGICVCINMHDLHLYFIIRSIFMPTSLYLSLSFSLSYYINVNP